MKRFHLMILLLIFNLPADLQAQGASRLATLEPLLSQSEDYSSSTGSRYRIEFERLVPEKGPDPDEPNCMFQDRHGFMWFGTSFGLLKYNGYTAIVYDHDPQNLNSLSDNRIRSLLEDSSGMIWVGTSEGLNRLDPESDTIVRYRHEPGNPNSLQNNTVYAICEDNAGVLWLGTGAGLIKRHPQTGQFTLYENLPGALNSDGHNGVLDVLEDKSGVLWIGSSEGLVSFDGAREKFVRYFHDPENPRSLSNRFIRSLYEDKQGVLWVGTSSGLSRMVRDDSGNISFERYIDEPKDQYNYSNNIIWSIFEDKSDVLWVAVQNGLYRMSRGDEGTSEFIRCQVEIASGYNNEKVGAVYEDNTGTLWIDVSGAVYKSNRQSEAISHYNHDPDNLNSLSHNHVTEILEDKDGILWLGTADGLNRFDRKNNKWTHFQADSANPNSLSHNRILSICEDKSNHLWIGTHEGGLNKFDPQKKEWTRYQNYREPKSISNWWVNSVYADRENVLWIGTLHGVLNKYDRQTDTFVWYENDPENPNTISESSGTMPIFEDRAGVLWIGTDGGGLNRFDRGQNLFTHYQHEPGNSKSLSHNTVTAIHEDQQGALWIGTRVGLNKLDRNETDSLARDEPYFVHYLSDRSIDGLLDDDDGNLWISSAGGSHSGLTRFNYQSETFRDFSAQGTLLHKSQRSGEMFVADHHHTGFYSFYPSAMKSNHHAPTIAITDFQIFNKSVPVAGSWWEKNGTTSIETYRLKKSLTATKEIELSYKESVFSFEFAALHYADPGKNEYAYKMEGFDDDWNYIGTRRFTTFTGLPAGEYTFRVKGSNNDGVWNEEGTSIKVIITPPPWKTWWAYTLYIIAVGATLYGIRRFELSRTRLKHKLDLEHIHAEKLEEIDRMKSRFFANISHEFRTPLTLILGPLEKLLSDNVEETVKKQFRVMLRNGRRLLRLINQLLDLSKLEAGSMSLKTRPENIIPLLKGIVLSFSSLAERKRITLRFQPPQPSEGSEPSEGLIVYVDRDKLEKIVSNLLSNAFKFTPEKGKISVAVSTTQSHAEITVADSGVGIPNEKLEKIFDRFYQADDSYTREQEGSGIGLALTKELVELHRGEIRVTSEPGMGTTFTVCLPLGKDHLKAEEEIAETPPSYSPLEGGLRGVSSPSSEEILEEATTGEPSEGLEPSEGSDALPIVLIVEDNADVRTYIRDYLEKEYQIMEAVDGEEGFEKSAEAVPDLIISDVMMPKMDGHELCRKLKTDERTSHIPVILLTARAGGESKVEGLETGADDYIIKPFDARELQVRVKNLIEQRRKLRERFRKEIRLQPKDIAVTSMDEEFLQKVMNVIEENLSDPEFSTEEFAKKVALSRSQLHRKLRALTDYPTHEFIRMYRLKRAAQLLQHHAGTVTEICYDVGFNSLSHFAKAFRELFGQSPSEFAASHPGEDG